MKDYKIAIIGGGPAGMMATISAGKELKGEGKVVLIEKNGTLGKKLLLTGGGRCNITNLTPIKDILNKFNNSDKNFLKHSFYSLDNQSLLKIFEDKGLEFKQEEKGRCFPITDDAHSVLNVLKEYLDELDVNIILNGPVTKITKNDDNDFTIKTNNETIKSEKVILATGGISYPYTGSTGDGYNIAKDFGHSISPITLGAIPLKVEDNSLKQLSGITLEDVVVSYKSKKTYTRGNVLITHIGLSGPGILDISNYISKDNQESSKDIEKNIQNDIDENEILLNNTFITLDLTPDTTEEELNQRIIADSQSNGKTMIKNYLKYYLKNRFIDFFLNKINVSGNKTISNMTKKDKNKIINNLKQLKIEIKSLPTKASMITCGGVNIDEINPKTMESNLDRGKGFYFAGELLEPYGPTGGYNLQIAFSTGYLAGKSASKSLDN